ncbi:HAD family hydrolase [Paenibacillus sp. LHD-38]|uniref:HAD family hydrolase n=1 Tax=Paenibacillus sp. LHD-38 TaxID=3072143 RepID=UPI00280DF8B9|nr:HAD family hydrolase [Paenibacillus sp. LHD-38]MDQ8739408.1 HAD family hydrolase [Paenibacillus sp. LHD-38]
MPPKAILFDLDETLTDRNKSLMRYSIEFLQIFKSYFTDVSSEDLYQLLKSADGNGYRLRDDVFAQLVVELPWAHKPLETFQISEHWASRFPFCSVATTGLYEVLDTLKSSGIILGIITNGGTFSQNNKIDALGIRDYLDTVIISETVKVKKPDSDIFAIALKKINVCASETWYIGDHPANDVIGAYTAGLTPVWIRGIHPWLEGHDEPLYQIDSIKQVLSLLPS